MVGVAPMDNGLGSDLITSGAAVVVAEGSAGAFNPLLDAVALLSCRTPAWVSWASC